MDHTLENFLRRALSWPDPHASTGWVNLHWVPAERKGITGGQAFKTLDEVVGFINWSQSRGKGKITDLYYCTSLQKEHGDPKQNGRYSPVRSLDNSVSSRLLFADVDKYASKSDAGRAILDFCNQSASPYPTALVDSGGGLHAYWFLPRPFPKDEWLELAHRFDGLLNQHGLKHDNISTDMSRVLRPPETLNFKRNPLGDPVVLKLLNGDIELDAWKSLQLATPTIHEIRQSSRAIFARPDSELFVDVTRAGDGPDIAFRGKVPVEERVGEGTLDPGPILTHCPMFRVALETGGEKVGQPVWHQQALACTFMLGGREVFHDLGRKHSGYSVSTTDDMYDRKLRDRLAKSLGYPSCNQFEREGCAECATCPIRGQVTSPLGINKRLMAAQPTASHAAAEPEASVGPTLLEADPAVSSIHPWELPTPENGITWEWGDTGIGENPLLIYAVEAGGKNKPQHRTLVTRSRILSRPIPYKGEDSNGIGLRVKCTNDVDNTVEIVIPYLAFREITGAKIYECLNDGGMLVNGESKINKLMLTIRGQIAQESKAMRSVPYGWEFPPKKEGEKLGTPLGFAYDGKIYYPGGKTRDSYGGDPQLRDCYRVSGSVEPFIIALRAMIGMKSPGLQAIVLSAFAAPLMFFSGHSSTVVMVRGDTGGSKSTGSYISAAVWAQPKQAVIKPSASKLAMMQNMGQIKNLPTIWDDIRTDMFDTVKDTLMEITQGGEGHKLDQQRNQRKRGTWDSMLLASSNDSLVEYLEDANKNNGAALARCFEFTVPKILVGDAAFVDPNHLARLVAELEHNHGHVGREYAAVLGSAPSDLQEMYGKVADDIAQKVAPYQPHERYWMAACATIMMAGKIVNDLDLLVKNGLRFDLNAIEQFLIVTFLTQRTRLAGSNTNSDAAGYAKHWLGLFINTWAARRDEVVWTIDKPDRSGKPIGTAPRWPIGDALRRVRQVTVRFVILDRKAFISKPALDAFLRLNKVSIDRVREGLTKYYKAKLNYKGRMASGLVDVAAQAQEAVYEIDVHSGSWLDAILQQHVLPEDFQTAETPLAQTPDQ
jgi:hypothetical protein